MKIMTIALAAATMAAFATTTTPSTAAPGGGGTPSTSAGPGAGSKIKRPPPRRCMPIYTRICYKGFPCRYVITGHVCNRF